MLVNEFFNYHSSVFLNFQIISKKFGTEFYKAKGIIKSLVDEFHAVVDVDGTFFSLFFFACFCFFFFYDWFSVLAHIRRLV